MTSDHRQASLPAFGSAAMFLGTGLAVLNSIELSGLPDFWYVNRTLWWAISFALIAAGIAIIGRTTPETAMGAAGKSDWRPSCDGVRFQRVILYTRTNCSLCDRVAATLSEHQNWLPEIREVDVDSDPVLADRFGTQIPVVEIDGRVRFRGIMPVALLRRLIEGTRPA